MNAAMKEQHFSRINDERARRVYDYLCASCELREGGLTDADQMLVYDYAYAEQVKPVSYTHLTLPTILLV